MHVREGGDGGSWLTSRSPGVLDPARAQIDGLVLFHEKGGLAMHKRSPECLATLQPTARQIAELDYLGDQIAELSAHLHAATARLLTLIREFDVRGGWNTGFRSCAEWLAWRVGLDLGAARERVRAAEALGALHPPTDAMPPGALP